MSSIFMATRGSKIIEESGVYLLGFPFDGTACFRKGAKDGPDSLREVSHGIETYSPYFDLDLEEFEGKLFDLGNLDIPDQSESSYLNGLEQFALHKISPNSQHRLLGLGGEHSISYPFIKNALETYPKLGLIHLDAHADLRDGYEGFHYSHASIIRRCLDHFGKDHQIIQYGIRSGIRDEYQWMDEHQSLARSLNTVLEKIDLWINENRPIYLTLDLDYFDPSYFPGTGTPEPGGEDFHSFIKVLKKLNRSQFVGADVTELAPQLDSSGNSSVFAAKIVRELLCVLVNKLH